MESEGTAIESELLITGRIKNKSFGDEIMNVN
jgi:hypothetical protein